MTVKKTLKWPIPLLIGLSSCFLWLSNAYAGSTLSAGLYHVCGIKDDSSLICWGKNEYQQAAPPEGTFTQVSAGYNFNCALRTDGRIACWGRDTTGETAPPPGYYIQVETGASHACALDNNRVPKCWGSKTDASYGPFQQLTLGAYHSCGFKTDGTVECWGDNDYGQTDIPAETTFSSIAAGYRTTCGIKTDGIAICWGKTNKSYGYLTQIDFVIGSGSNLCGLKADHTLSCPSMGYVPSSDVFSYVTTGGWDNPFACGIKADGSVTCWGYSGHVQTRPPTGEDEEEIIFKHEVIPPDPCSPAPCFTQADMEASYEAGLQAGIGDIVGIEPVDLCVDGNTCGKAWFPPLEPSNYQGEIPIDRFRRDDGNLWYNPVRFESLDIADASDVIDATHYRTDAYKNAIEGFFQIRYACEASWNSGAKDLPWIPANVVGAIEYCVYPDNIPEVVNYLRGTADKLACENGMEVCE